MPVEPPLITPSTDADDLPPASTAVVQYEFTPRFAEILAELDASLFVSTYQAGKVLVLGTHQGRLTISFLDHDQPMGLAAAPDRIAIGTRREVWFLVPAHEALATQCSHDGCFIHRQAHATGSILGHDIAWGSTGLWIVNTLFSCLSTLDSANSFVAQWRPPFISQLAAEDRCHLNGMAMDGGVPRFVTALGETDTPGGWRPDKATGGIVMHVPSGTIVCRNLAMPHSPRLHAGRLWVLDSGRGGLGWIDTARGRYEQIATMPGYTRGLACAGRYAFVGLSAIREKSVFGGLPLSSERDRLYCGVGVVDLAAGSTVAVFKFNSHVSEIFAIELLQGFRNPRVGGAFDGLRPHEVWVVPREDQPPPPCMPAVPLFARESASAVFVEIGNRAQGRGDQWAARTAYEQAVATDHECLVAWKNLGCLLCNMGEPERAAEILDTRVVAADPSPENRLLAASVLPVIYDSNAEIAFWRSRQERLLRQLVNERATIDVTKTVVPTSFFTAYQAANDRELMGLRGRLLAGVDHTRGRSCRAGVGGRFRVGAISAYFRDHTIGRLNVRRLEELPRKRIELTVISASSHCDPLAARFHAMADRHVEIAVDDLGAASKTLAGLDLDLLLFMDVGMDPLVSTLAFSRFAPVQVATWGHPDTTGSPCIDYFLSSDGLDPDDGAEHYTEQVVRLPSLGIMYDPPEFRPAITRGTLGLPEGRRLYVCPQTLFKLHPDIDELFRKILTADAGGEIILLDGGVTEWRHRLHRRLLRTLPHSCDERIRFLSAPLPRDVFLSLLRLADVVLDPPHFGGGNTSIEAVSMGAPVVTLEGLFLRSRITATLLRALGVPELIAADNLTYCDLAVNIAGDRYLRERLSQQLSTAAQKLYKNDAGHQLEMCLLDLLSRR